jgi:ribosomal protein S18 acetylase RimI-like enzyme
MELRRADPDDVELIVPLFDGYRQFYGQPSDPARARAFIGERLSRGESVIFLAMEDGEPLGFTQLYPVFSSTHCRPLWILNDLYVAPEARRRGVARMLMDQARDHAVETGACGIQLETAHTNSNAQRLYESLGYQMDKNYRVYELRF